MAAADAADAANAAVVTGAADVTSRNVADDTA